MVSHQEASRPLSATASRLLLSGGSSLQCRRWLFLTMITIDDDDDENDDDSDDDDYEVSFK